MNMTTAFGLKYTACGYESCNNGIFTIKNEFKIVFENGAIPNEFNRFELRYSSNKPLRCNIIYTEDGQTKEDDFFLEAGKKCFSCLIRDYLDGKYATDIKSFNVGSTYGEYVDFSLDNLDVSCFNLCDGDTYYVENDRYKIGIRLPWGGGISYIEDKKYKENGLKNLVNQADTGRLIQQSYYGTGANGEYTPGEFNGSKWCYNPVQGGDKYQNHSRIIDIEVTDNSVYVKSQPQDWSLDGQITPSYMENKYTIGEDTIRVDNRFVDFSGWNHAIKSQELPAFYTVSYLSRFTLYNGSEPWTDGELQNEDNLNFWGDSRYARECTFLIKKSNTETWCAWSNKDIDFGIGLYVPNVDSYFAGKHEYNGSKDPENWACNYVAPVNIKQMVSFEPIEYSYLITTGSVDGIRAVFKKNRDFADNRSLHENYTSRRIED